MRNATITVTIIFGMQRKREEATKLDPNKSTAHLRLAKAYAAQGQQENAVKEYQEVLRLNPEDPAAHYGLGGAYNELGQKDQAIASL